MKRTWMVGVYLMSGLAPGAVAAKPKGLPSLKAPVTVPNSTPVVTAKAGEIEKANLQAASVLYAASALEEMKLFEVADKLADLFLSGKLPVGAGARSQAAAWVKTRPERLSASERQRLYGHVLGGSQSSTPNVDFPVLWSRFLKSVDDYGRIAKLAPKQKATSAAALHKAARELAQNLTARTHGAPLFAAAQLAKQLREADALLRHPDTLAATKSKDLWQVVEHVAKQQLGASINTVRGRTLAEDGADILDWLSSVSNPVAASGGAGKVAASAVAHRVPKKAREVSRIPTLAKSVAVSAQAFQVKALCFDAKRHLIPCKTVQSK